jgi:hypothetical protein
MPSTVNDWLQIVRGEYLEIPDLALTRAEIQRMWGLESGVCDALLDTLTRMKFLHVTRDLRYVRGGDGAAARLRAGGEHGRGNSGVTLM